MEEDMHDYLRLMLAKDAGLIFLCVCGAILNGAMLYMLIFKKQVRTSVHTVYMIQIAVTDLLVCLVWLALTCIVTNNLLRSSAPPPDYESNDTAGKEINGSVLSDYSEILADDSASEYRLWRIMYSWYNFHYYTNIFLLSSMSVERCAAVWKSMRCQRYQYNRKAIYSVSAFMWILALAFVLPNFINPDMIVSESDSATNLRRAWDTTEAPPVSKLDWKTGADPLSRVFQGRSTETNDLPETEAVVSGKPHLSQGFAMSAPCSKQHNDQKAYDDENKVYKSDLDILFECYTLLAHARKNNRDFVQDYNSIVLEECLMDIAYIAQDYNYESSNGDEDIGYPAYSTNDYGSVEGNELESYFEEMYEDELSKNNNKSPLTNSDITYDPANDIYPWGYNKTTNKMHKVRSDLYYELLTDAVHRLIARHQEQALDCVCDPHLNTLARVYILVINLTLGFFIPFCIIVISYGSIAYMIGKRARSRMNPYANAEGSTTQYGHYYQANPSTTNIPLANLTHGRERSFRRASENMGRRMSDLMRQVILRKNNPDAENRSYWSESERECSPYGSMQKVPLTSSSKHRDYSGTTPKSGRKGLTGHGKIMERIRNKLDKHRKGNRQDKPGEISADKEESNELMNEQNDNGKEHSEIKKVSPQRIKKHSFGYDATNEHIPQTIEEHPHEAEDAEFEAYYDKEYRVSCNFNGEKPSSFIRGHHPVVLQIQRNSRRESGGSYGSSIESMATDQTSLLTSLGHDKRLSAATTISALTPPTPAHPGNPNANAFFPPHDEKIIYNRSQSAEPGYPASIGTEKRENQQATSNDQRSPRPGSQLNDVTFKLLQNSMMKKPEMNENDCDLKFSDYETPTDDGETSSTTKYSKNAIRTQPNISRSISAPEERMLTTGRPNTRQSKSSSRIAYDTNRLSNGDSGEIQQPIQASPLNPKYNRQNSSTSTVFFTRGRTYSTTSNRSMLGSNNTLRKTMARKNAERHLRVSHTVLAYVIVFAICWLPQRIVYLLYVTEGLMGATAPVCVKLILSTRIVSFISVLLNPIVYIVSQRDIRAYVRKSVCLTKLRQWCSKLKVKRKQVVIEERRFVGESEGRQATNPTLGRHDNIELRQRPDLNDKEDSSNGKGTNAPRAPIWTPSAQRPVVHHRRNSGDFFAAAATRRRDATIDEMKEEEAAAEESLEKEMERLAEETRKRENDKINKNWFHVADENAISDKEHSGSGNKSASSGSKSDSSKGENLEEFWMRWLRNGGADFLSPTSDEMPTAEAPRDLESSMAELDNIVRSRIAADPNNEMGETII